MSTRRPCTFRNAAFLAALCVSAGSAGPSAAQQYRNIVNDRFATVSTGPMQALVVDVANPADTTTVNRAVAVAVNVARAKRASGLQNELNLMRRYLRWKKMPTVGVGDIVYLRQSGKLVMPPNRAQTRGPNTLTFNFPVSQAANDEGWTQAQAGQLTSIANILNAGLQQIYGAPAWNGTVKVMDGDNAANIVSDPNALAGGVYNVSTGTITIAQYNSLQSTVLNLCQMMAIAYHGPDSISYDAWERGMARAATLEVVRTTQPNLDSLLGAGNVTPNDPLWVDLDRYDWMNQPPLGNDRFFPISQVNGVANTASFPNMMIPRLMMSGSAWLKCQAESGGSFLSQFNAAYYVAFNADSTLANNVPALKGIAEGVLPNVEGMPFSNGGGTPGWYEQQYVLDTSVSPGYKEYALPSALVPEDSTDSPAIAVILYYYQTGLDSQGNSTETDENGTTYPIYWDNTFTNRLFLGAQYESVDVRDGIGAVAPTFPDTLGGANGNNMRIAMDFPIGFSNVRLYVAPRNMVSSSNSLSPNNFWGVVVGTDTGTLKFTTDTGVSTTVNVVQGAFGTNITTGNPFTRPSKGTLTFTDTANNVTVRHVNLDYNELIPVIYTGAPVQSVTQTLPAGLSMISFPIQPLAPVAANALLDPTTGKPIFNAGNLLMAQWRQDINSATDNNYLVYPSLGPIQPGTGYWANLSTQTPVQIYGRVATPDQQVSIALLYGWNQIADPYTTGIPLSSLTFQDEANNVGVDLDTAVSNGWIGTTSFPTVGSFPVFGFDQSLGYQPVVEGTTGNNMLMPWQGYWIRVTVSEGVTITYANPVAGGKAIPRAQATGRAAPKAPPPGWALPITVHGQNGYGSTAWLGQSSAAQSGYNPTMDALSPPAPFSSAPSIVFAHPELGKAAGNYMTEVHPVDDNTPWEMTVTVPDPKKTYTLTWSSLATVSRTVQLMLVDETTGAQQFMRSASSYSFTPGGTSTRKFKVVAEPGSLGRLTIQDIVIQASSRAPGSPMQIRFNLSQGATVNTEIMASNGKAVRHLQSGRALSSGANALTWDMRDDRGIVVPSGAYLVHIIATAPDGGTVRSVQPLTIVR